jgi:hypothetical protein
VDDMKRIYCELHLFDLDQSIYLVDPSTGEKEPLAVATIEELAEVISAICDNKQIYKVLLTGNSILSNIVSEEILTYSKKHYNWNNIEVEVIK